MCKKTRKTGGEMCETRSKTCEQQGRDRRDQLGSAVLSAFSKVTKQEAAGNQHTSTPNYRPYNRYIQHMIYSGPWLVRSGRTGSDPKWLEQTTERRRLLMGDFENGSYKRFHGPGPIPKL